MPTTPNDNDTPAFDGGDEPEERVLPPTDAIDTPDAEEIVDPSAELAAHDENIAALYMAIDGLGDGRVNIHAGAQRALFEGQSTVLASMALLRAYQRVMRLVEWSGTSSEGSHCPVCGMHRESTSRAVSGPNRGHAENCPLRRNLDNLNRAIGIPNRGRRQGPGTVMVWDGRARTDADSTPPEQFPSPLTPEGVVTNLVAGGAGGEGGTITLAENRLAHLLRMWTLGRCSPNAVQQLAGSDAAIDAAIAQGATRSSDDDGDDEAPAEVAS